MAYGDFKGLSRRTASDKIFRDKAFNIAINPKYEGMLDLPQWFVIFDKKKLPVEQVKITLRLIQN